MTSSKTCARVLPPFVNASIAAWRCAIFARPVRFAVSKSLLTKSEGEWPKEYYYHFSSGYESLFTHCFLSAESQGVLMPLMCATERCFFAGAGRRRDGTHPM